MTTPNLSQYFRMWNIITTVIVLLILAVLAALFITSETKILVPEVPANPSVEYLMTRLNATDLRTWDQVDEIILGKKDDPEMIAALSAAVAGDDTFSAIHANYLLFRLRNNPVDRLNALFTYLRDTSRDARAVIALEKVFLGKFGPEDIPYLPEFEHLNKTDDGFVARLANKAITDITASTEQ